MIIKLRRKTAEVWFRLLVHQATSTIVHCLVEPSRSQVRNERLKAATASTLLYLAENEKGKCLEQCSKFYLTVVASSSLPLLLLRILFYLYWVF